MSDHVEKTEQSRTLRQDGVAVGVLLGLTSDGSPLVAFAGGDDKTMARTTVHLGSADIGSQVALMFENGDPAKPLVIGRILVPGSRNKPTSRTVEASIDQETLTLSADREIVLRCGKASITLTRAGKIILRGAYVLSRSSGVNKIKGASVQIN